MEQVVEGVWVQQSDFCRSNAVVVRGHEGVLVVDPGIEERELLQLAEHLRDLDLPVVAGFSTHPHWDHLLWHEQLGEVPRYGTARCAAAIGARLCDPAWPTFVASMMPPDLVDLVPLELFGQITGLPDGTTQVPWDGPVVRIIEHAAHAPGHAALLIEDHGVLVAGDLLSDVLVPMLSPMAPDPVADHLAALDLLATFAGRVDVVVPGHGSLGRGAQVRHRIDQDRAYLHALREGTDPDDVRIGPDAPFDWVAGIHEHQQQTVAARRG